MGTAILWKKDIDHLITRLPDGGNRIQCIEMACKDPMVIISVYMPCKGLKDNRDEFADCLAQLREICQKCAGTHTIILGGDFNEDLNAQRESERKTGLENFIRESELKTNETGRAFVNADGVEISTIDYIFCSKQLIQKVVSIGLIRKTPTLTPVHQTP